MLLHLLIILGNVTRITIEKTVEMKLKDEVTKRKDIIFGE